VEKIIFFLLNYLIGAIKNAGVKKKCHVFDLQKMKAGISTEFLKDN
jgi:hypothetical protein